MKELFEGFEKIHISNIASLIIDQATCNELPLDSFNERLNQANRDYEQIISELVSPDDDLEKILEALLPTRSALREVYFEAGILCGIKLANALSADTDAYRELMRRCNEETEPNNP